jgi:UDP-N-acetylglucosamine transferase subunit ALG13
MILLTVGTQFPFDRLVKAVDDLCDCGLIREPILAQIGDSKYRPRNFEAVASLDKGAFDRSFLEASAIIGHAGMGTITMALENSKPLLAMPRRKKYGEVVNDHQVVLAIKFEALGHILLARDETELPDKIGRLASFVPKPRRVDPSAVAGRIDAFLEQL